jgi:protein gp37
VKYWNATLRVTHGCTPVNGGCNECWAARAAFMHAKNPLVSYLYRGLTNKTSLLGAPRFNGTVVTYSDGFKNVLRKKKPKVWQIWNDLFHSEVPDTLIAGVVELAAMKPDHTFIALTKRPDHLLRFSLTQSGQGVAFPRNMFVGVSVSCMEDAEAPLYALRWTKAESKIISYEPAVGPVDFRRVLHDKAVKCIIAGGETGPRARVRPCPESAIWSCMNDCRDAGCNFFFKGWGSLRFGRMLDGREWSQLPWEL